VQSSFLIGVIAAVLAFIYFKCTDRYSVALTQQEIMK